jgi:hypothetical protein
VAEHWHALVATVPTLKEHLPSPEALERALGV